MACRPKTTQGLGTSSRRSSYSPRTRSLAPAVQNAIYDAVGQLRTKLNAKLNMDSYIQDAIREIADQLRTEFDAKLQVAT